MKTLDHNTVFFLGAGFSKAAGAPTQAELLDKALTYSGEDYGNPIKEYQARLNSFLHDAFSLDNTQIRVFGLEDFYTPIDKCILDNSSFRGYSLEYIKQLRYELSMLISIVIDNEIINMPNERKRYIDKLIQFLHENRERRSGRDISIISTNWDILIDRRIRDIFGSNRCINYGTKAFYILDGNRRMESLKEPLKLFKIHGSLNWLKCPSCNKLYVNPAQKIGIREIHKRARVSKL